MSGPSFDRLVSIYRLLEFAAFGRDLERARFCFLDRLASSRRILVFGEGDGRALARLVELAPDAEIHSVDISAGMIARASARLRDTDRSRVVFHHLDALAGPLPHGPFDAVTTMFFLDCFTDAQVGRLVTAIVERLTPDGQWLWADFRLPERGFARLRARMTIPILYAFFRWQTGIPARVLPEAEAAIRSAGFDSLVSQDRQGGLIRTRLYRRTSVIG